MGASGGGGGGGGGGEPPAPWPRAMATDRLRELGPLPTLSAEPEPEPEPGAAQSPPWTGKTMKLKVKLLKNSWGTLGGDFEMEIDATKKVRHPERRTRLTVSSCCSLYLA